MGGSMAGIAVCAVFVIAAGAAVSALLHSDCPTPRHAFILDLIAKLAEVLADREDNRRLWAAAAA